MLNMRCKKEEMLPTVTKSGLVHYGNQTYRQVSIHKLPPPVITGDTCYWCVAYSDLTLCNAICMYCKEEFVFIKKKPQRVCTPLLKPQTKGYWI